jgi:hypothetical protein
MYLSLHLSYVHYNLWLCRSELNMTWAFLLVLLFIAIAFLSLKIFVAPAKKKKANIENH